MPLRGTAGRKKLENGKLPKLRITLKKHAEAEPSGASSVSPLWQKHMCIIGLDLNHNE
jgi:hypothetical protein